MKNFNIDKVTENIGKKLSGGKIETNLPMSKMTTFRIGGSADVVYTAASEQELADVVKYLNTENIPYFSLGGGSNLLVRDSGYRGVVIRAGERLSQISVNGKTVVAGAGARLSALSSAAVGASLSGLEFASGIPGSVGGALMMNAGAYDMEIKDTVKSARAVMPDGNIRNFTIEEMQLSYRHSAFMENDAIIVSAEFELSEGDKDEIMAKIKDLNERRRKKQPLEYPSAGSTFKRPENNFAGKLIEESGCSNLSCGGARVSPKHAGFIVNDNNATAADVLNLIELVKIRVMETSGVELEPEIHIIGE